MKTFYTLLLFLFFSSVNVYSQIFPNDLLVNIENQPSTFIQKNPVIFSNGTKGYLSIWEDYREGDASIYAQVFDSLNNKVGSNFQFDYQMKVCFNSSDGYLGINPKTYYSSLYFPPTYTVWGKFYNQNNQLLSDVALGSKWMPECGLGWLGIQEELLSFGSDYFFLFKFDHEFRINKLDEEGNYYPSTLQFEQGNYSPIQFSSAVNSNGEIFLAWKAISTYQYDSLTFNTAVLDTSLNYISEPIRHSIIQFPPFGYYEPENNWHTVVVADSLFEFFNFDADSMKLKYQIFDKTGNIYQDLRIIDLPSNSNPSITSRRINAFSFSPIINDKFQVLLSVSEFANWEAKVGDFSILYNFDSNGEFIGEEARDSVNTFKSNKNLFKSADGYYYLAADDGADVFSVKHDQLTILDSVKINDDLMGSNERYPAINKLQNDELLITWSEPAETFGRRINSEGLVIGDEIELDGKYVLSFNDNCNINFWTKQIASQQFEIGFSKLDNSFTKITETVADTINNYRAFYSFKSFDDSTFVYCFMNEPNVVLRRYNLDLNKIAEDTLAENITYVSYVPLFLENNSFWVNWSGFIQKFSFELEPQTDIINLGFRAELYLGNNNFLDVFTSSEGDEITYGKIISTDGSIINSAFILANSKNNVKIGNLTSNEFLTIYHFEDNFYLNVFDNLGELKKEEIQINENNGQKTADGTFRVEDEEIYFAWSDDRIPQTAYDIFVNAMAINTLVNIEIIDSSVPEQFSLSQNYPNPFNPVTKIKFKIPNAGLLNASAAKVLLRVYDILGNEVVTLVNEQKTPGTYEVEFDGSGLASGVYIYKLEAGKYSQSKKLLLLK